MEPNAKVKDIPDSTGYGIHRYETWLTVKGKRRRHRYLKLHLLIPLANLAILNQNITRGTRHDSPILKMLLKPLPKSSGDLCADAAYPSRRNCNLIATKGRTPIIKPKRTTTMRKHGSQAWRDMIALWLEDQTTFLKRYHQRSKAESVYSVYSALKRCHGNHLSNRRRTAQRRELHLRTLSYKCSHSIGTRSHGVGSVFLKASLFLASNLSDFITGVAPDVNGGALVYLRS